MSKIDITGMNKEIEKLNDEFRHYKPNDTEVEQMAHYKINMLWDGEADVWVATSDDVPGLVLESDSFDTLISRIKDAIPELLELNGKPKCPYNIAFQAERMDTVAAYG